jgi:hypothetical protein
MRAGVTPSSAAARRAHVPQPCRAGAPAACTPAAAAAAARAAAQGVARLPPRRARALVLTPVCAARRPGGSLATRLVRHGARARCSRLSVADAGCAPERRSRASRPRCPSASTSTLSAAPSGATCASASRSLASLVERLLTRALCSRVQVVRHQRLCRLLRRQHRVAVLRGAGGERHRCRGAGGDVRRARDARILHRLAKPVRPSLRCACSTRLLTDPAYASRGSPFSLWLLHCFKVRLSRAGLCAVRATAERAARRPRCSAQLGFVYALISDSFKLGG